NLTLILCADDDVATDGKPGLMKATEAAHAVMGKLAIPNFGADRPEGVSDFNDMMALCGAEAVARAINESLGGCSNGDGKGGAIDPGPYAVSNGCICKIHYGDKGNVTYDPVCNFDAKVTEEILLDDGAEVTRAFVINGSSADGKKFQPCRIPASRFASMSWVTEQWGLRAVVNAGHFEAGGIEGSYPTSFRAGTAAPYLHSYRLATNQ